MSGELWYEINAEDLVVRVALKEQYETDGYAADDIDEDLAEALEEFGLTRVMEATYMDEIEEHDPETFEDEFVAFMESKGYTPVEHEISQY